MTTRVEIVCPDQSHQSLKVIIQDRGYDHTAKALSPEWRDATITVLKPGEKTETHVYDSRRVIIEEINAA